MKKKFFPNFKLTPKAAEDHSPLGKLGRRAFLKGTMATGATLLASSLSQKAAKANIQDFGVASGDPTSSSIVIWTKIPEEYRASTAEMAVYWQMATDENFSNASLIQEGLFQTHAGRGYSVKLKVENLSPFTRYYYRFFTDTGYESVIGRTLTAPDDDSYPNEDIQFAYISCNNYTGAHWHVYKELAKDLDLHFCVHLGDAVYEHYLPGQAKSVEDWRQTYALLLSIPEVREARRLFPWIYIWDDHEVYNDFKGAGEETDDNDRQIQANAYQVWWEFMPANTDIEPGVNAEGIPTMRIYRTFNYGAGIDLFALDGRQYRDGIVCGREILVGGCDDLYDINRTKLGAEQNAWLKNGLQNSTAEWKFLLNQCMMMPLKLTNQLRPIFEAMKPDTLAETSEGFIINLDQWDGYPANRQAILEFVEDRGIENLVVLTGDIHNCYVGELKRDFTQPRGNSVGVEFVTGSVTSYGIGEYVRGRDLTDLVSKVLRPANPHMKWLDALYHTYGRITVRNTRIENTYIAVSTIDEAEYEVFELKTFHVESGDATVRDIL